MISTVVDDFANFVHPWNLVYNCGGQMKWYEVFKFQTDLGDKMGILAWN